MPQTLSPEWSDIDNEEHKEYLHTLGNLTLTFDIMRQLIYFSVSTV
jgi:hypothetical protein